MKFFSLLATAFTVTSVSALTVPDVGGTVAATIDDVRSEVNGLQEVVDSSLANIGKCTFPRAIFPQSPLISSLVVLSARRSR